MFKFDRERARWETAIDAWRTGDASKLSALLRSACPLPDFVRDFLASVVDGSATRKRGARKRVHPLRDAMIQIEFQQEVDKQRAIKQLLKKHKRSCVGTPKDRALKKIGKRFNISDNTVKGIVYPPKPSMKPK